MTKFLNISTDNTLGGNSPSDDTVSSQKAIKAYVDSHTTGSPSWGSITGTLSNQTDLQNALNGKQNNLIAGTDIKITGIPSSYVALSFIETSGTQYINTLIPVNDNNKFEIVFANDSNNPNSDRRIISQGNNSLRITANTISWFSKNYHFVGNISADVYNTVICGFNFLEINGSNIQGISDSDSAAGTYVYLFSTNSGTSNSIIKLKSFKVWNSAETLVGYFIPVKRLSDNKIGLYDVVSELFFTNSGTGDFVGGESSSTSSIIEFTNDSGFITSSALSGYQTTSNLVTSVSSSSTDSQYPSAKLFYDTCGDIESLINAL